MRNLYNNLYALNSNWEPTLLTHHVDKSQISQLFSHPENVHQLEFLPSKNIFVWFSDFVLNILFHKTGREMYREAKRLFDTKNFDLILCSTSINSPLYAGIKLSKHTGIPLIVDFRDLSEQSEKQEFLLHSFKFGKFEKKIHNVYARKNINIRNKLIKNVNHIITVSRWHENFLKQFNPNTYLIYNGFDEKIFVPQKIKSEKFIITYAGRFASTANKNIPAFFKTIKQLADDNQIDENDIRLHWYLNERDKNFLANIANEIGVQDLVEIFNIVSNEKVPDILNKSSILLIFSAPYTKGVMTTKFFEYLGVEKPVLCIMSDEGDLENAIIETNAGLAARNLKEIEKYIIEQHNGWKLQGYTHASVNQQNKKQFSRQYQAQQFVEIFNEVTKNGNKRFDN